MTPNRGGTRRGGGRRARGVPAQGAHEESGPRVSTGDAARDRAVAYIAHQAARFPDMDVRPFDAGTLAGRDAALSHALADTAVRRWLTLAWLVRQRLAQPLESLEPPLRGALIAGAAQIAFFERVPAHAAINHSVEWAKRRLRAGAGAMVNAVLRRVAEIVPTRPEPGARRAWAIEQGDALPLADGSALPLVGVKLPAESISRLEAATGHPRALLEAWVAAHGEPAATRIGLHGIAPAPVVVNLGAGPPESWPRETLGPHTQPGFAVYTGAHADMGGLLADHPDVWVQDAASAEAVESVAGMKPRPRVVYDVCAGLGTKTRQLARTFPEATVYASDPDPRRAELLRAAFAGHARVRVIEPPVGAGALEHAGRADLVLLDVPCSNTGVLARRPEAKHRYGAAALESLAAVQRQIIADAIPLLSGRGRLLYSTCSLEDAENGAQARWAAKWHRFAVEAERLTLPSGGPGHDAAAYSDGSYSVMLRAK